MGGGHDCRRIMEATDTSPVRIEKGAGFVAASDDEERKRRGRTSLVSCGLWIYSDRHVVACRDSAVPFCNSTKDHTDIIPHAAVPRVSGLLSTVYSLIFSWLWFVGPGPALQDVLVRLPAIRTLCC